MPLLMFLLIPCAAAAPTTNAVVLLHASHKRCSFNWCSAIFYYNRIDNFGGLVRVMDESPVASAAIAGS
jgi:hypothetical protein